jgi:teichuronic acid biosynthesis glycosyltransferase TuaG
MPAYNASAYISESIKSVMSQTFLDWELIIIDDGSTDNTAEIVKKYLSIDNRIFYYYQENGKQGKARNLGIVKSKGYYLAFLDADDMWLNNKLEVQLNQIKSRKVNLVFSSAYVMDCVSNIIPDNLINGYNGFLSYEDGVEKMIERNRVPILTVLVEKAKVVEVGMFSEQLEIQNAEDSHLWLRLLVNKCIFYGSNKVLAIYRDHGESVTKNEKDHLKLYINVLSDIGFNNKDFNFKVLYHLVSKQVKDMQQLKNEVESIKNSFLYKFKNYLIKRK